MKNTNILNEINEMKYLFGYKRGKVISEQSNIYEVDEIGDAGGGTTTTTVVGQTTTVKAGGRKSTGLEVQKLLNTKFSAGLKEDGRVGPLTLGAMMNALEGSTGGSTTTPTTTVAGSTTPTTTVAGSTTPTTTVVASSGGGTGSGETDSSDI